MRAAFFLLRLFALVFDERSNRNAVQHIRIAEERQPDHPEIACNGCAALRKDVFGCIQRTAGGDEVIDNQNPSAGRYIRLVYFQNGGAVFQFIGAGIYFAGELSLFAD